jgi:hemolysin-activating ACP:hemolysin acyltransferase
VKEENHQYGVSEKKRRVSSAINQVAIGAIILLWGSLLILKQVGVIEASVSILPFVLAVFGALLIFGGIYRYYTR